MLVVAQTDDLLPVCWWGYGLDLHPEGQELQSFLVEILCLFIYFFYQLVPLFWIHKHAPSQRSQQRLMEPSPNKRVCTVLAILIATSCAIPTHTFRTTRFTIHQEIQTLGGKHRGWTSLLYDICVLQQNVYSCILMEDLNLGAGILKEMNKLRPNTNSGCRVMNNRVQKHRPAS